MAIPKSQNYDVRKSLIKEYAVNQTKGVIKDFWKQLLDHPMYTTIKSLIAPIWCLAASSWLVLAYIGVEDEPITLLCGPCM